VGDAPQRQKWHIFWHIFSAEAAVSIR
jgi:hypothetical protein